MKPLIKVQSGPRNARTDPETGVRFYTWMGVEYPSVTSVRNLAGLPIRLANWRTNQVIEKAMVEYQTLGQMLSTSEPKATAAWLRQAMNKRRDEAADLGKRVHDAVENDLSPAQVPADMAPFLLQYRSWLADSGATIVLKERQVWNLKVGYAGTFDFICVFPNGQYWLIDLKTGSGTYPEHAMQTEAYARCEFVGEDDVIDLQATHILQEVGPNNRAVLHLRPDGWSFKALPSKDETWIAFRGMLVFALWATKYPDLTDGLISGMKEGHA